MPCGVDAVRAKIYSMGVRDEYGISIFQCLQQQQVSSKSLPETLLSLQADQRVPGSIFGKKVCTLIQRSSC